MRDFTYNAPAARSVRLVGDFTNWHERPIPLRQGANGIWHAAVRLEPGAHDFRFVVEFSGGQPVSR